MLLKNKAGFRNFAVLILFACTMVKAQGALQLTGLAVHTDTARDIYVAGLQTPDGQLPGDFTSPVGPMIMEYRIATRRISSRGFSGTLLLQAELGSGHRAPEGVIDVLGDLKQRLQGSLLSSDQFEVSLTPAGDTRFLLNGIELLESPGSDVFAYLLQGWVGDSASALMRESLLSGELADSTLLRYESLIPLTERVDQVAAWVGDEKEVVEEEQVAAVTLEEPAVVAEPEPEPVVEQETANTEAVAAVAAAAAAPAVVQASTPAPSPAKEQARQVEPQRKAPEPESEPQPAAPQPVETQVVAANLEDTASAVGELDDREYQLQLSEYVRAVMTQVFKNVRYPRRAVKRELQGQVELLAELDQNGDLLGVSLESSSGHEILDEAAIRAVEKATPFPELSFVAREEFVADSGDNYVMLIPVKFMMN